MTESSLKLAELGRLIYEINEQNVGREMWSFAWHLEIDTCTNTKKNCIRFLDKMEKEILDSRVVNAYIKKEVHVMHGKNTDIYKLIIYGKDYNYAYRLSDRKTGKCLRILIRAFSENILNQNRDFVSMDELRDSMMKFNSTARKVISTI